MGQTVNLLAMPSVVRIHPRPQNFPFAYTELAPVAKVLKCGSSSVDRASAFQAEGREFEPRLPLYKERVHRFDVPSLFYFFSVD